MKYTVQVGDLDHVSLSETDDVTSILQNIAIILKTRRGTCPQYREFGLPQDYLGLPIPAAKVLLISEIKDAVEAYEPRAMVLGVTFAGDADTPANLVPIVEVEINVRAQ